MADKEVSSITEAEIQTLLGKDIGLVSIDENPRITLSLGKVSIQETQSSEIPEVVFLEIQCRDHQGISSSDSPRTYLLPVRKEQLINLAASLLREYRPSFEDRILSALQQIEDRLPEQPPKDEGE